MIPAKLDIQLYRAASHTITIDVDNSVGAPFEIVGTNQLRIYRNYNQAAILTVALTWNGTALVGTINTVASDIEAGSYPYHLWNIDGTAEKAVLRGMVEVADVYVGNFVDSDSSVIVDDVTYQVDVASMFLSSSTAAIMTRFAENKIIIDPPTSDSAFADDAAAEINAAIVANAGRTIELKAGRYHINTPIGIATDHTSLIGQGWGWSKGNPADVSPTYPNATILIPTVANMDVIDCAPTAVGLAATAGVRVVMVGNRFADFTIDTHPDLVNDQTNMDKVGLKLRQLRYASVERVAIWNMPLAYLVSGVQYSEFNFFRAFAAQGIVLGAGSTLMKLQQQMLAVGDVDCWENRYSNFILGAPSALRESVLLIRRGDGEVFNGGYVSGGSLANIIIKGDAVSQKSIHHIRFANHRCDASSTTTLNTAQIYITQDAGFTAKITDIVTDKKSQFNGSKSKYQVYSDAASLELLNVGGLFGSTDNGIITVSGDVAKTRVVVDNINSNDHRTAAISGSITSVTGAAVTDNTQAYTVNELIGRWFIIDDDNRELIVSNTADTVTLANEIAGLTNEAFEIRPRALIDVTDVKLLAINGLISAQDNTDSVVELSGTVENFTATNLINAAAIKDIIGSAAATFAEYIGNLSQYNADYNYSLRQRYVEFMPEVAFGTPGATPPTCLTAGTFGNITIIGSQVFLNCRVTLTAKGDGTGEVYITEIPFVPQFFTSLAINIQQFEAAFTGQVIANIIYVAARSRTEIQIKKIVAGNAVPVEDSDITNGVTFRISGSYHIATS